MYVLLLGGRWHGSRDCISDGAGAAAGARVERPATDRQLAAVLWLRLGLHAGLRDCPVTSARQISSHVRHCLLVLICLEIK